MRYSTLLVRLFAAGLFLATFGGAHRAAAADMFPGSGCCLERP
jgi:hypothetical protein